MIKYICIIFIKNFGSGEGENNMNKKKLKKYKIDT